MRGMFGFTSAMMMSAESTAARTMSTDSPRLTKPWRSGSLTWMSATSTRTRRERMRAGISERKIGMKSARPSCTAFRTLAPMKNAVWRNRCSMPGSQ